MEREFDYEELFTQAIDKIKSVRDPRATRGDLSDPRWGDVEKEIIFDFEGVDLKKQINVSEAANKISFSCIHFLIINLMLHYGYSISELKINNKPSDNLLFALMNKTSKELLIFKTIEQCPFWKTPDKEPEAIRELMRACDAKSCRYIYFLFDNAFYQVIGHNNDEADPGRGYNVYSLKWFFETYFSEDEYRRFELALKEYIEEAKDYIGYSTIKTLSQNSLVTFKKITENTLLHYPYENLKAVRAKQYELFEEEFKKVRKQFIEEKKFLVMLGSMDFSESLITAEWLYDSMKKAKAIDLTIIGMGYFKSVEQLLYSILKINECESVSEDINLGSMAHVFKDNIENTDLIRDDLVFKTRRYIRETIFDYANLRNGYLHKHNIHEWTRINEIRDATFRIIFLLLGGCNLNDEKLTKLGYSEETFTDYYRLCEYINFHSGELFYLDFEENGEQMGFGVYDRKARFENGKTVYSGFYIKELSEEGKTWCFVEEHLPKEISLGKFVFRYDNGIKADPVKVKVIFKDGRFVGPSIAEEDGLDY